MKTETQKLEARVKRLEGLLWCVMRNHKQLPHCDKCGVEAANVEEVELIDDFGKCLSCTAEEDA